MHHAGKRPDLKKNSSFSAWSEPCPRAVWITALEPLSRGGGAQAASDGSAAEVRLLGKSRGHRTSQRATRALRVCWYSHPLAESPTNQPSSAEGLGSETWRASVPPCKEPWPRADQTDTAVKVGPAFRGKQNTRDKGWYTMALFKIIIKKKKKKIHRKTPIGFIKARMWPKLVEPPWGKAISLTQGMPKNLAEHP